MSPPLQSHMSSFDIWVSEVSSLIFKKGDYAILFQIVIVSERQNNIGRVMFVQIHGRYLIKSRKGKLYTLHYNS